MDIVASHKHMEFLRACKDERYTIMQGGRRSGKTWSILQYMLIQSLQRPNTRCLIVTDTFARLSNTLFTDLRDIAPNLGKLTKGSNPSFQLPNGSYWNFVCANRNTKGYSSIYDFIFFNEAIQYEWNVARDILKAAGDKCRVFADYNPYTRFWVNDEFETGHNKLITTYHDNQFIPEVTRQLLQEQEVRGRNAPRGTMERYLYEVECLGVDSARSGLCFPNCEVISMKDYDSVEAQETLGMDWGVVHEVGDPDAIIAIKVVGDDVYVRELWYPNTGTDKEIADVINAWREKTKTEYPLAVYEYASFGENRVKSVISYGASREMNWRRCSKRGVQVDLANMCRVMLHVTENSPNFIEEQRNYKYVQKGDNLVPVDRFNHAMDALRYAWNGYNDLNNLR